MEENKSSKIGVKANTYCKVFIIIQILALFSLGFEYLADGFDVFLSRLGQNMLILFTALSTFNLGYFTICIAGLIGMNFICIGALVLALMSLLRYKNKEAKSTVALCIFLITATSILALGSRVPFN